MNLNDTVYIRNLNEKVGLNTLKSTLKSLFEPFGPVLDIVAHKNLRMRGQAFVALSSSQCVDKAVDALDGKELFQKKIVCVVAKQSSDSSVKNHGDEVDFDEHVNKRKQEKNDREREKEKKHKVVKMDDTPLNKVLLIQQLGEGVVLEDLTSVFDKYKGFVEVRLVSVRRVAFVEFESDKDAVVAKEENMDLSIKGVNALVSFAKK